MKKPRSTLASAQSLFRAIRSGSGPQLFLDLFRGAPDSPRPAQRLAAGLRPDEILTEHSRTLLRQVGAEKLAEMVTVAWNSRLTTTAGLARFRQNLVILNPRLQPFGESEVDRTLRHELGHLLAHFRAGRRRIAPHGPEWKRACADLGLPDEKRCHELPLPRRTVPARHIYTCGGCGQIYRRVRPFRKKVACLRCCRAHCRGRFHEKFVLRKLVGGG